MTKKLFKKELQKIVNQIAKNYSPQKIILFGSAASGKANAGSDIDMLIIKNTTRRFVDRIGEVLENCDYQIPIEPLVYTPKEINRRVKLGDFFIRDILKTGKLLYDHKS